MVEAFRCDATRRGFLAGAASAGTLVVTGCGSSGQASYRFTMRVEARTLAGARSGESVLEESAACAKFATAETGKGKAFLRGDGVMIDLPGGPVFALLKIPEDKGSLGAFATQALTGGAPLAGFDDLFRRVRKLGGWFSEAKAELPRDHWPILARFGDINDPKTVEEVCPENLGVKRISLETTSAPVSTGIRKTLVWLSSAPEPSLNPNHGLTDYSLAATLHHVDFIHEKPL